MFGRVTHRGVCLAGSLIEVCVWQGHSFRCVSGGVTHTDVCLAGSLDEMWVSDRVTKSREGGVCPTAQEGVRLTGSLAGAVCLTG